MRGERTTLVLLVILLRRRVSLIRDIVEADGRFEHQHNVEAVATNVLHNSSYLFRLDYRLVDGLSKLLDQVAQAWVHSSLLHGLRPNSSPTANKERQLGYGQDSSTLLLTRAYGNWEAAQNVGNLSPYCTATLQMQMNPNEFGKKLGIGVRVAGRIAKQRAEESAQAKSRQQNSTSPSGTVGISPSGQMPSSGYTANYTEKVREARKASHKLTRAAGRGVGGFLRPFGRVGGILWLEVTGFFFGLFALFFAVDVWRMRLSYAAGPQHFHFLTSAGLTGVFCYLSASAFWRAGRK